MNNKRRDFIKSAGLAGLGLAGSTLKGFTMVNDTLADPDLPKFIREYGKSYLQHFNMSGYAAPKLNTVRIGIIGLGNRGSTFVRRMDLIEGVEIKALCDLLPERVESAQKRLEGTDHKPCLYAGNKDEWKKLCERDDIDLVFVTTPWYMHAEQGVYAMEHGKHVASEVPAAGTIEECWQLVKTSERTRRHFMMMANTTYGEFQLITLNMARQGFFGDIVHGDCAYNTSKISNNFRKGFYWDMWWLRQYANRKGNLYPTHGLGPVCQIMDINRGDKLEYLVSVESNDFIMNGRAEELAGGDDFYKPFAGKDYRGNMNVTTIRTKKGRTIMLQHDASTPSPHTNIHSIHGTRGAALEYPLPPRFSTGNHQWVAQEEFGALKEKYTPEIITRMGEITKGTGHGGMDGLLVWRLIDCLRNGLPLDQDVYDAASWSAILPLSEWSVLNRSNSIDIPDFTAGSWETNERNMDINLERGGTTKMMNG
jgi:predicted dehydrogenase